MNETELLAILPALDLASLDEMLEQANLTSNGDAYDLIATEIFKRPEFVECKYHAPYHLLEEWHDRCGDNDEY